MGAIYRGPGSRLEYKQSAEVGYGRTAADERTCEGKKEVAGLRISYAEAPDD